MKKIIIFLFIFTSKIFANNFFEYNNIILDAQTNLMWLKNAISDTTWNDALQGCYNDTTGDYNDWRLPNVNELQTIIDYSKSNPAIDTDYFINFNHSDGDLWTSTRYPWNSAYSICIRFYNDGAIRTCDNSTSKKKYYTCVRNR